MVGAADPIGDYMRELVLHWTESDRFKKRYESQKVPTAEEARRGRAKLRRGRKRAKVVFLCISAAILAGCVLFPDSGLRVAVRSGNGVWYYAIGVLSKLIGVALLLRLNRADPGYIPASETRGTHTAAALGSLSTRPDFCRVCRILKPERSKHCKICGRCVARFDHHCPFVGNCIGARNHRMFWWFLAFEAVASWAAVSSCRDLFTRPLGHWSWTLRGGFSVFVGLMAAFATVMLLSQTVNVIFGITTYEGILKMRFQSYSKTHETATGVAPPHSFSMRLLCCRSSKFSQGIFCNVWNFCAGRTLPRWFSYDSQHRNWFHLVPEDAKKRSKNEAKTARAPASTRRPGHAACAGCIGALALPTRGTVSATGTLGSGDVELGDFNSAPAAPDYMAPSPPGRKGTAED